MISNPLITAALLTDLATDSSRVVRGAAIRHPEVPLAVLEPLLDHADEETSRAARSALNRR